jgi:DNA adenine methylase
MGFFRYPGGKTKLRDQIITKLNQISENNNLEYREPFFGGGSIGLNFIQKNNNINKIWINDLDKGLYSLWTTLINQPNLLKQLVKQFKPSVDKFDILKNELTANNPDLSDPNEIAAFGFKKLAIHQISYSGLGTKSGGPLGGREQKSIYKIDCRWSPDYICKKIDNLHNKIKNYKIRTNECTNLDFSKLILDTEHDALIYLDPPYYDKGGDLYQHAFQESDHIRLADALQNTKHKWVLSYDDCPEIRQMYNWATIETIDGVSYSITATKDKETGERKSRTKPELLITPPNQA